MGKLAIDALFNSKQDYKQSINVNITVSLVERDSIKEIK